MNFLFAAPPLTGHVNPVLSMVRLLTARGHTATMIAGSAFRRAVEASGAAFEALPEAADADALHRSGLDAMSMEPGPKRLLAHLTSRFIDPVPAQHRVLERMLAGGFDALLVGSMFYGALPTMMRRDARRTTVICCNVTFLMTERDDEAPAGSGIPPAITPAQTMAALAARREADEVLLRPLMERLNARLAEVGAAAVGATFGNVMAEHADLFLQTSVPGFEYPRLLTPASVRFVGPMPLPPSGLPAPDWIGALGGGWRRVVLVTQGTLANGDLGELIGPALAGLADQPDLLVVASTGGRDPSCLPGPLPANARVASFLPFERILPKVDVLVTNGGFGTVTAALAAGVPIVAAGQTEDKAEVSARIQWSGAGIDLRTNRPSAASLRDAVRQVLEAPGYRMNAARLARESVSYDAWTLAPSLVEECMDRQPRRRGSMASIGHR